MSEASLGSPCVVSIAGERVELLPERAAYWAAQRTLIAADLHLGKCETLRAAGVPVPPGVIERDLGRLEAAVRRTGALRVLVVGDLIHHASGLSAELVERVGAFRAGALGDVELVLVRGNHDRRVDLILERWRVGSLPDAHLEVPFGFAHDPADGLVPGAAVTWFGHLHPLCRVGGGGDGVCIPCFMVDRDHVLLPAFSQFTQGVAIRPRPEALVFGVAEGRVHVIPTMPTLKRRGSCLKA